MRFAFLKTHRILFYGIEREWTLIMRISVILIAALLFNSVSWCTDIAAQTTKGEVPESAILYFREDWKETPAEIPLSQKHVANPDLILKTYGPGADSLKKSHHDQPADDPWYVWSGQCRGTWALALKKKDSPVDLSKGGYVRWRTKQAGDRVLRVILGLEDGMWIVSEEGTGATEDWTVSTLKLDSLTWRELDISAIKAGKRIESPNFSRVKLIGCTDLMPGEASAVCTRLDWVEVYGGKR